MCLSKLKGFKIKLDEYGVGEGWKIFELKKNGELHADYFGDIARPQRRWLNEKDYCFCREEKKEKEVFLEARSKVLYKPGWHIFLREKDAKNWLHGSAERGNILKRVKFRNIVASGTWVSYKEIIVAKEIFIPKSGK